ncbi:MAG: aminopeptidase N [Pseudomonadaceae bacterium]|nr:aminopeptidase N [Pseudomonadaceae bacterium]
MKDATPNVIRLADYTPAAFTTTDVELDFDIREGATTVRSTLNVVRQRAGSEPLELDGEHMQLVSLQVDGEPWVSDGKVLDANAVELSDEGLRLFGVPDQASIAIETIIEPENNKALEGLYHSGSMYCTQCEAQGFRRITYYQDRPDVLARFTTSITADAARYPTALSNGNCVADEMQVDGRRRVTWEDPFPKPSYLFALVCGDLSMIEDAFVTASGRKVTLQIFSEPHNIDQCDFAMDALKRSMRWDEVAYGREYDLDIFMIVAVEDFNMGAMENKGLNIFNTAALLTHADTATDAAYERVEAIVAHEYFHNWSGNRVTCRDWFQLSLKEGFTVFRDSQFSSDQNSETVKRIEDISFLRAIQFVEDGGPMAHPIRPDSYIEISNFYTPTVYEKGAEVVRMLHTIVGAETFRAGSDLYFDRFDGSAATTEDFVSVMEEVSGIDLGQFRLWYTQAGTPVLTVSETFEAGKLTLTIEQHCPPTPGQDSKAPMHIPVLLGLTGANAAALESVAGDVAFEPRGDSVLLHLKQPVSSVTFKGLASKPEVSFLRGFSAPVRVEYPRSDEALAILASSDTDGFARWDVLQTLILNTVSRLTSGDAVSDTLLTTFATLLDQALSASEEPEPRLMLASLLTLPSEAYLLDQMPGVAVDQVCAARDSLRRELAHRFSARWQSLVTQLSSDGAFEASASERGRRGLLGVAFSYAALAGDDADWIREHYYAADNLTDRQMALAAVLDIDHDDETLTDELLSDFSERFGHQALCMDAWFRLQATSPRRGQPETLTALEGDSRFDASNPNKIRALYGAFAMASIRHFHALDGSGYRWLTDRVLDVDSRNPQMASRLVNPLIQWRRVDSKRGEFMRACLERIVEHDGLSKDVFELVSKGLS